MRVVTSADGYEAEVRSVFSLHAEADIKEAVVIKQNLSQIELEDVRRRDQASLIMSEFVKGIVFF